MRFVWDDQKALSNLSKHGVTFEEASTVFRDPLSATGADPDHSLDEQRWITFAVPDAGRLLVVAHADRGDCIRIISAVPLARQSEESMKKRNDPDELRTEYSLGDFPAGLERGKYAARMVEGSNIVRLDPDIARSFPDSPSVNEALRSLLRIAERASAQTKRSSGRS